MLMDALGQEYDQGRAEGPVSASRISGTTNGKTHGANSWGLKSVGF